MCSAVQYFEKNRSSGREREGERERGREKERGRVCVLFSRSLKRRSIQPGFDGDDDDK
jgi:hypothetical protein